MSSQISQRLSAARRSHFIGRSFEQELFRSVINHSPPKFNLLFVYGPGGVGKTTLMKQFNELGRELGARVVYLDARNLEPSPAAFLASLAKAFELEDAQQLFDLLARLPETTVILLDTFETIISLDDWLRVAFLPFLPEKSLVVLAARHPPSPSWRTDPGWTELMRVVPLRNFAPDETRSFLSRRAIPESQQTAVMTFTHGHPLALSLVAEAFAQRPGGEFAPEASPDIVKTLVEKFIQEVPGAHHRAALEASSLVRVTTEAVLASMLEVTDAPDLFEWLRSLSFMETRRGGLFPHDLARDAIVADLRWRNPDKYVELHRRARQYYFARMDQVRGYDQQRVLWDLIYLHRENPAVRPYFEWQAAATLVADVMQPAELPALVAMVDKFEGPHSAKLAEGWLRRYPKWVVVLRDAQSKLAGFFSWLELNELSSHEIESDPALLSCHHHLQSHAPLRKGEIATLFRFWMAAESYQEVSQVQSILFINVVRYYLTTMNLAYTFLICAAPDFWAPGLAYGDLHRLEQVDFEIGERKYGVFGHDWRVSPPMAWLDLLAERELGGALPSQTFSAREEPLMVLSRQEFDQAVREGLRYYTQPLELQDNPLLRSRLVAGSSSSGEAARSSALRLAIQQAAEGLKAAPRTEKLYRVIDKTYLHPAPTQEAAAELLDLPFSTFRRHLKAGIDRIIETLWQKEISG